MLPQAAQIAGSVVRLRAREQTDQALIYSSWLRSFRASKSNVGIDQSIYYERQARRIDKILARAATQTIVACDPIDDEHVYGYLVCEPGESETVLHYIYIKQSFRRLGIGRALMAVAVSPGKPVVASHYPANEEIYKSFQAQGISYDPEKTEGAK